MLRDEGLLELERWQRRRDARRPDPDERPGADQLAPRPAGAEGEAARSPRVGDRCGLLGRGGRTSRLDRGDAAGRSEPRPGGTRASRLRRASEGVDRRRRRGVLVQAHPHAGRGLRAGAEGTPRAAPPGLLRVGQGACRAAPTSSWRSSRGTSSRRVSSRARSPAARSNRRSGKPRPCSPRQAAAPSAARACARRIATTRARSTCSTTSTPTCASTLRVRRADMAMMLGDSRRRRDELLEVAERRSELGPPDGRGGGTAPARRHRPAAGAAERRASPAPRGRRTRRLDRRRSPSHESGIRHEHVRRRLPRRARPADREPPRRDRRRRGDRRPRARRRGPSPHRGAADEPRSRGRRARAPALSRARGRPR